MWENVIATDVDDTTTEARARIVAVAAPCVLDPWVRERERGRHLRRGRHGKGHVLRALRLQGRPVRGRQAHHALVDDLVAALDARRPGRPSPPRPSPPSSTTRWVTKPAARRVRLPRRPRQAERTHVARRSAATLRDAVARRLRAAPTDDTLVAAGQLVETCLGHAWRAWSPRRRTLSPAAIAPASTRAAVAYNDLDHRVGNTRHHGGGR